MSSGKERGSRFLKIKIAGDFERRGSEAGDVVLVGRPKVLLSLAEFETLLVIVAGTHDRPSPEFAVENIAKTISRSPDTMYRRLRALNKSFEPLGRDLVEREQLRTWPAVGCRELQNQCRRLGGMIAARSSYPEHAPRNDRSSK